MLENMFDPLRMLLSHALETALSDLDADPSSDEPWAQVPQVLESTREQEAELAALIDARDVTALRAVVKGWQSGERQLPAQDREVLKRALKALRKRIKLMRLDQESRIGGGAMSGGLESTIAGITPPDQYPPNVWAKLASQGRLIDCGQGVYELPPS